MDYHARVSGNNKMVVYITWTVFVGRLGYPGGSLLGCGLRIGVNAKTHFVVYIFVPWPKAVARVTWTGFSGRLGATQAGHSSEVA